MGTVPSLPELFEARAPGSTAVIAAGRTLRYAELQAEVGRIAAALADSGCGRGSIVGVCAERTALLPAALLAVLRSGAASVAAQIAQTLRDRLQRVRPS